MKMPLTATMDPKRYDALIIFDRDTFDFEGDEE